MEALGCETSAISFKQCLLVVFHHHLFLSKLCIAAIWLDRTFEAHTKWQTKLGVRGCLHIDIRSAYRKLSHIATSRLLEIIAYDRSTSAYKSTIQRSKEASVTTLWTNLELGVRKQLLGRTFHEGDIFIHYSANKPWAPPRHGAGSKVQILSRPKIIPTLSQRAEAHGGALTELYNLWCSINPVWTRIMIYDSQD